jgi:hypothetical protein
MPEMASLIKTSLKVQDVANLLQYPDLCYVVQSHKMQLVMNGLAALLLGSHHFQPSHLGFTTFTSLRQHIPHVRIARSLVTAYEQDFLDWGLESLS